jgi:fructose-specific phosphotransferase system IIC component
MDVGGSGAFGLMVPILAGFIGLSIADRPGFMPAMVAGVMANQAGGGFLGGLIGGFVGGYVVLGLKKAFAGLPETLEGIKPVLLYPLFGLLLTGIAMKGILIPVVSINNAMSGFLNGLGTGNLVVLGIILGGMMAVDMGGPVNKAAFAFGIAAISTAPGNAGIAEFAECVNIKAMEFDKLVAFAKEKAIDLTIIGMDDPLVGGVVDAFESEGCDGTGKKILGDGKNIFFSKWKHSWHFNSNAFVSYTGG